MSATDSDAGIAPLFWMGAVFDVTQNLSIRGEWERPVNVGDDNTTGEVAV